MSIGREADVDQDVYPVIEDFRSLLNTSCKENSEMTVEHGRLINSEIRSQMSKKVDEIEADLNSRILQAINSAIAENDFPTIQTSLGTQESCLSTK